MSVTSTDLDFSKEYCVVVELFDRICTLDTHTQVQGVIDSIPDVFSVLADQRGRFRVWAGNVGAHRTDKASLQHRLREAPHFRSLVHGLLQKLNKLITEGVSMFIILNLH